MGNTYNLTDVCAPYEGLSFKEIESRLFTIILGDYAEWKLSSTIPKVRLKVPSSKWKVLSSVQKCVRRGNVPYGVHGAVALHRDNAKNLYRRLSIMAFEDIGLANPELALFMSLIKGRASWIESMGGPLFTAYLVTKLCESLKDRTICDIAYGASIAHETAAVRSIWPSHYDPDELKGIAVNSSSKSVHMKHTALAAIGGSLSTGDRFNQTKSKKNMSLYTEVVETYGLPSLLNMLAIKGGAGGLEGLAFAVPLLSAALLSGPVEIKVCELPSTPVIGGVPALAYDKHVQEGKRAYAYFSKSCHPVAKWLESYEGNKVNLIGSAFFNGESGSLLDRMLIYPEQEEFFRSGLVGEAAFYGLTVERLYEFYELVNQHHDTVNQARDRIINGK